MWTFFQHNFPVFRVLSSSLIFEKGNTAQKKQEAPGKQIYLGQRNVCLSSPCAVYLALRVFRHN